MTEPAHLMDTLVKLASLGTSGICIFAIFWIGWIISRPEHAKNVERQKTLRSFMLFCIVILIVSAGASVWKDSRATSVQPSFVVRGVVHKDDGADPGDCMIYIHHPPLSPDGDGKITGLNVKKDADGAFPILGFNCPGYALVSVDLNDEKQAHTAGNVIALAPVELHKFSEKKGGVR